MLNRNKKRYSSSQCPLKYEEEFCQTEENYDLKNARPMKLAVGDLVLKIKQKNLSRKGERLDDRTEEQLFCVESIMSNGNLKLIGEKSKEIHIHVQKYRIQLQTPPLPFCLHVHLDLHLHPNLSHTVQLLHYLQDILHKLIPSSIELDMIQSLIQLQLLVHVQIN